VSIYLVAPLLIVIAILQSTVVPHLTIWDVFPDLPVLVVVSWSLLRGAGEGVVWGFISGLAVDLLSGAPFGAATLSFIAIGFLSGLGEATVFGAHVALPLITTFLATILYDLLFLLIVQISGNSVDWMGSLFRIILPSAVFNAALMPIVFLAVRKLHTWFGREEMEW
jgi:rod shape-determining protein MreD